jgi:hypothetical protein
MDKRQGETNSFRAHGLSILAIAQSLHLIIEFAPDSEKYAIRSQHVLEDGPQYKPGVATETGAHSLLAIIIGGKRSVTSM